MTRPVPRRACTAALLLTLVAAGAGAQGAPVDSALLRQAVAAVAVPATQGTLRADRAALRRLYEGVGFRPLWVTGTGVPTRQAMQAVDALEHADTRGLRPADYDAAALYARAVALAQAGPERAGEAARVDAARFDAALSASLMRLLAQLHAGRVDPTTLRFRLPASHEHVDLAGLVTRASRATDVAAVVAGAEPPFAGYAALTRALARYRALAADSTLRPPTAVRKALRPGAAYADAPVLRRLLAALGDLSATARAPDSAADTLYDAALVDAVMAFQRRHGLEPDGIIGPATSAQLRVPLARRVEQIALALERWRWLPDDPPARYLVVNIPAFQLRFFERDSAASCPVLVTDVIVGQAEGRHDTPVFVGTMRQVVFRPYWDVPLSIARNELLPKIRRDRSYMDREDLEIVRGGDDDAVIHAPTAANLARVAAGTLRLRQRPGPKNSLGLVKFLFPNPYNVYLHGTPAQQLFGRARRDFSHGCIRVAEPVSLAEAVLRGQDGWDRAAIEAAMQGTRTQRVDLERPVTVFVLYATVVADDDGTVHFHPDLYGHDAALARVLGTGGDGR
ncbi:MAG TPA: L,D-transpeptidase family protein [Gemmatimonadaceae bacterium]